MSNIKQDNVKKKFYGKNNSFNVFLLSTFMFILRIMSQPPVFSNKAPKRHPKRKNQSVI